MQGKDQGWGNRKGQFTISVDHVKLMSNEQINEWNPVQ